MGPERLLVVLGVGFASGIVNTLAGAGSLITLPALLFLGLPAPVANATNRVGVVFQSGAAVWTFSRAEAFSGRQALRLLVPAGLGAALGAGVSTRLDPALFERVIAVAMVLVLATLYLPVERWSEGRLATILPRLWFPVMFALGFYGGFLQAGVGIFLIAGLRAVEGVGLVEANALKAALVAGFTAISLVIFGWAGLVDGPVALALAAGSAAGGWLGSRAALRGGARLIRGALTVAVLASSARLLGLW